MNSYRVHVSIQLNPIEPPKWNKKKKTVIDLVTTHLSQSHISLSIFKRLLLEVLNTDFKLKMLMKFYGNYVDLILIDAWSENRSLKRFINFPIIGNLMA